MLKILQARLQQYVNRELPDVQTGFRKGRRKWQPTPVFLPGESRDSGAWWAAVYGVTQSRTRLSDFMTCIYIFKYLTAEFSKGRGTRDQIANICWIIEKAREFQKKKPLLLLY